MQWGHGVLGQGRGSGVDLVAVWFVGLKALAVFAAFYLDVLNAAGHSAWWGRGWHRRLAGVAAFPVRR